jgi:transcriptional regulator with XRE-family HTH domain
MSSDDLKHLMERHGITAVDIASVLKMNPTTIKKVMNGEHVHRNTLSRVMAWAKGLESQVSQPGSKYATG